MQWACGFRTRPNSDFSHDPCVLVQMKPLMPQERTFDGIGTESGWPKTQLWLEKELDPFLGVHFQWVPNPPFTHTWTSNYP